MDTDYNKLLYEKMQAENETFKDWLLSQEPSEILNHAYEYTMYQDMMLCMEDMELSPKQAKAMYQSPSPLRDTLSDFDKRETDHMENLRDSLEATANKCVRVQKEKAEREAGDHSAIYCTGSRNGSETDGFADLSSHL